MPVWGIHTSVASLNVEDTPLAYQPPVGPAVAFHVNYDHLEQNQPSTRNFSNLGPKWNFSWLSYLTFDSNNARAHMGAGGTELYTNFNSSTGTYDPEQASGAMLYQVSANVYERRATDGSKLVFNLPDGSGRIFLTQVVDAQGNALVMTFDANYRLVAVTDAAGQVSTLTHGSDVVGNSMFYVITKVTDPFGRFTTLTYNPSDPYSQGSVIQITDEIGLASQFQYQGTNFAMSQLITPYGTTNFTVASGNVQGKGVVASVDVATPNGEQHHVESVESSSTPANDAALPAGMPAQNGYGNWRNSYYWDAKASLVDPTHADNTKARLTHFLHFNGVGVKSSVVESAKDPLESRVWYSYQDQNNSIFTNTGMRALNPTYVGRLMDDGSTQLDRYSYNALGNVTQSIDPLGRTTNFTYAANGIDPLTISQVNAQGGLDPLAVFTWNSQHRPLSYTDAAGSGTVFTYNARGQITAVTNARSETTAYAYDANGYLLSIDGPLAGTGDKTTFTYDAFGRIRTTTNGEGYTLTADYDNLDRLTKITFPDGTYSAVTYTNLDATQARDRLGNTTSYVYNAGRQLVSATDPLNRVTTLEWCTCGGLKRMIDSSNHVTAWDQDLQGRQISKTFPDGTKETYTYQNTNGRLASVTDASGQVKNFSYNLDDTLAGVSYLGAQQATLPVSFTYDPAYLRPTSMTDGTGPTTYTYGPVTGGVSPGANLLTEVNTLWTKSKVNFTYDAVGRELSRSINGVTQTTVRDGGGRAASVSNALGTFTFTYDAASGRPTGVALPNNQSVAATYLGNAGDRTLQQVKNLTAGGALLSQFDYTYDATGQILTWAQRTDANPALNYSLAYDAASQLTGATTTGLSYAYTYDKAGNLLTRSRNAATTSFSATVLNELQSVSPALAAGTDKTYLWDAENRLVGINYTGTSQSTRLTYDGLGRCVGIAELTGTTVTSTKRFVWCGDQRCEERDASGAVTRRFFAQGEQVGGASYYYSFDHLGSVREMTDATGATRARYDYDPYGVRTKVSGDLESSAGFTGHYVHAPSGLHLANFRAYDAATGRWLSRDPLQEAAGTNMYAYVKNNPVNQVDPLGLLEQTITGPISGLANYTTNLTEGATTRYSPEVLAALSRLVAAHPGNFPQGAGYDATAWSYASIYHPIDTFVVASTIGGFKYSNDGTTFNVSDTYAFPTVNDVWNDLKNGQVPNHNAGFAWIPGHFYKINGSFPLPNAPGADGSGGGGKGRGNNRRPGGPGKSRNRTPGGGNCP